eukprot:838047_1
MTLTNSTMRLSVSLLELNEIVEVQAISDRLCKEKDASTYETAGTEEDDWDLAPSIDDEFQESAGTVGSVFFIPLSGDLPATKNEMAPPSDDDKSRKSPCSSLEQSAFQEGEGTIRPEFL